jgi:AcrR family transcriptional regulator
VPNEATSEAPARRRRSTAEIVERLLSAASEEFERNGYDRTKTATIAKKAAVTEALIFNHFGSKANLFQEAIFKPLNQHFLEFCKHHVVAPGDAQGLRTETAQYVKELHGFVEDHSRMLMSLVVEQLYASEMGQGIGAIEGLEEYFSGTIAVTMERYSGTRAIDPDLLARISFATIFACAIFKDWLFANSPASEDEIRTAIGRFVMDGVSVNHANDAP